MAVGALLALTASSCSSNNNNNNNNTTTTLTGRLCQAGSVQNSAGVLSCNPVGGVKLAINGAASVTANEQGYFTVESAPAGDRVSVCFSAANFADRCRNVAIRAGQAVQMSPTELLAVGSTASLGGAQGQLTAGNATATIGPSAICKADRTTPVTGAITCSLTPLDASSSADLTLAPGSYLGTTGSGDPVQLASGGMLDITCTEDGTGDKVNVCQGKSVHLRIPITANCADGARFPDPMDSWGFEQATGLWKKEASFAKTCAGSSGYYEGDATHFSYWNADQVIQTTCLSGTVKGPTGLAVDGARVVCQGTSFQGSSEAYTGADGTFCVPVMKGGQVSCSAEKGGFAVAAPVAVTAQNTAAACGGSCQSIGLLTLSDPLLQITLTWGELPSDLDSYWVPQGYASAPNTMIWFGNRSDLSVAPFVALDTDDTSSFGPEITTAMPTVQPGKYRFCIHNYSGETGGPIAASGARVQIAGAGLAQLFTVPTANPTAAEVWRVLELNIAASGAVTLTTLDDYRASDGSGDSVGAACWAP